MSNDFSHLFLDASKRALHRLIRFAPKVPCGETARRMVMEGMMSGLLFICEFTYYLLRGPKEKLSLPVVKEMSIGRGDQYETFFFKPPADYSLDVEEMRQVVRMEKMMGVDYGAGVLPYTLLPNILLSTIPKNAVILCKGDVKRTVIASMTHDERTVIDLDYVDGLEASQLNDVVDRPSRIPGHERHMYCSEENAKSVRGFLTRTWPDIW